MTDLHTGFTRKRGREPRDNEIRVSERGYARFEVQRYLDPAKLRLKTDPERLWVRQ